MDLAVIIPALNEAEALPLLLGDLRRQSGVALQIIVVDGGSSDSTVSIAEAQGCLVIHSAAGRARQMNAGRAATDCPLLLFLHADSRLPDTGQLAKALARYRARARPNTAAHFPLRFIRQQPGHEALFNYLEARTRTQLPYTVNGDQGLLIQAEFFDRLGGYDESLPFLEDLRIAKAVEAQGQWLLLPGEMRSSARRFESEGHLQRYLLMGLIVTLHEARAWQFFDDARALYTSQDQTRALEMGPWFALARRALAAGGPLAWCRRMWRCGRLTRDNYWQLLLRPEVLLEPDPAQHPTARFLRWHSRLRHATRNPLAVLICSLIAINMIYSRRMWRRGIAHFGALPEA